GLPHRLEFVCTIDGISYYDDSISTTCQSCISGIKSFNNVGTILIGGLDRGIDYTPLVEYLQDAQVDNIILFSQTANRIKSMLTNKDNVFVVDTLLSACNLAKKITAKNKVCLLSPAAASYCDFKNFEERGEKFKEYIKQN
ncbi:MAG: UDP-N-acetylmuramoyl-L-alanine--D-glutamate ligase, partial [Oscillospiraceae bacterium]